MRACVLTQKSEQAPASSASLLATPMELRPNASSGTFFIQIMSKPRLKIIT